MTSDMFPKHQTGFSLIELLISITLGLLVLLGVTIIAVNNIRTGDELERSHQQIENGRYAIQLMGDEFRNAGFFAEFNPMLLPVPAAKPDPCSAVLSNLNAAMPLALQGYDKGVSAPTCLTDIKANTDIIVMRRVSTCALGDAGCDAQVANAPYFQASSCGSLTELGSTTGNYSATFYALDTVIANLIRHKKDCTTLAPIYQYLTRIYFIANNDKPGDGIPTLKRAELGNPAAPGGFTIVSLVEGIEDMQLEYGIDNPTSTTGSPVAFTADPDSYNSCTSLTSPTCTAYWANTVAVKIHLLARNVTPTAGYTSSKTYAMGLDATGNPMVDGPFGDAFKRHVYESSVRVNNVAGRNTP